MPLGSSAIQETQVYAQDSQPADERDGVLWVDTSVSPRETYVYSADSGSWESIAEDPAKYTAAYDWVLDLP